MKLAGSIALVTDANRRLGVAFAETGAARSLPRRAILYLQRRESRMSGTASTGSRVSDHAPDIAAPSVQSNTSQRFSRREGKDALDHCRVGYAPLDLKPSDRELPMATSDELRAFRAKAIEIGLTSLTTAA